MGEGGGGQGDLSFLYRALAVPVPFRNDSQNCVLFLLENIVQCCDFSPFLPPPAPLDILPPVLSSPVSRKLPALVTAI